MKCKPSQAMQGINFCNERSLKKYKMCDGAFEWCNGGAPVMSVLSKIVWLENACITQVIGRECDLRHRCFQQCRWERQSGKCNLLPLTQISSQAPLKGKTQTIARLSLPSMGRDFRHPHLDRGKYIRWTVSTACVMMWKQLHAQQRVQSRVYWRQTILPWSYFSDIEIILSSMKFLTLLYVGISYIYLFYYLFCFNYYLFYYLFVLFIDFNDLFVPLIIKKSF